VIGKVVGNGDLKVAPVLTNSVGLEVSDDLHHLVAGLGVDLLVVVAEGSGEQEEKKDGEYREK
jgi:hypothetical protein